MEGLKWAFSTHRPLLAVLVVLLALTSAQHAAAAAAGPTKWTFLVYMLADNNLEPFGLYDLEVGTSMHHSPHADIRSTAHISAGQHTAVPYSSQAEGNP
jgi:hypothetical protein